MIATPDALLLVESAPHVAPLHPAPESIHATPLFCASLLTVAVNGCVPPAACTLPDSGETTTVIAGGAVRVMFAVADFVPSATEVAFSVTVAGEGTVAGAI